MSALSPLEAAPSWKNCQASSTTITLDSSETVNVAQPGMERLLTKIGAPSYLPTPAEVIDGVRWLRENPAIAAGVVVGLTSYSVAKYYEYGEDSDESDDNDENTSAVENATDSRSLRATRDEIARSVTALHLGLLKIDEETKDRHSIVDSTTSTDSSSSSGGLRSRASSIFDKIYLEELQIPDQVMDQAWSCLHGGECPPGEPCNPDWGLFALPSSDVTSHRHRTP